MYHSAVEGRGSTVMCKQSRRQDLTSTSAECWRLSAGLGSQLVNRHPETQGPSEQAVTPEQEVNGTASYKPGRLQKMPI